MLINENKFTSGSENGEKQTEENIKFIKISPCKIVSSAQCEEALDSASSNFSPKCQKRDLSYVQNSEMLTQKVYHFNVKIFHCLNYFKHSETITVLKSVS